MDPWNPCNVVSVHLDMVNRNDAGTIFVNLLRKLVVLRWDRPSEPTQREELVDCAVTALADLQGDALIWDMRRLPAEEGSSADIQSRLRLMNSGIVRRFAALSSVDAIADPASGDEFNKSVRAAAAWASFSTTFSGACRELQAAPTLAGGEDLCGVPPSEFSATYGGSIYYLPDIRTVVVRNGGNYAELDLGVLHYSAGLELAHKMHATAVIMDSSATPPVVEPERFLFVYKHIMLPYSKSKLFSQVVHVRTCDRLQNDSAPPLGPMAAGMDLAYFEADSLQEAVNLIRVMQGKKGREELALAVRCV